MGDTFRDSTETMHIAVVEVAPIHANRGWFIGLGITFALLGVLAIFLPLAASLATTLVLGWLLVFDAAPGGGRRLDDPRAPLTSDLAAGAYAALARIRARSAERSVGASQPASCRAPSM